ncbi:MAG: hypothetical protein ACRDD1_17020 [Planctomycetia bacterium]
MATNNQRLTSEERNELVAFLDGEADPTLASQLSLKIDRSVSARREVDALKQTWELLDHLPRPNPSGRFTQHTIELVKIEGRQATERRQAAADVAGNVAGVFVWVLVGVGCFVGGLVGVRFWPDRNLELARDLPIIERLDDYQAAGDLQFLKQLHDLNLLDELDHPVEAAP